MKDDKPSSTALLIGKSILMSSADDIVSPLIPKAMVSYTREFIRAAYGNWTVRILEILGSLKVTWAIVRFAERLTVPGMIVHYILRKRRLEEWLTTTLDDGVRQLIVIGAGLDTLGIRSAEKYKNINVLEIDHPATQSIKRKAVDFGFIKQPENFEMLACDLSKVSLGDALRLSKRVNDSTSTMFVAEGLFMYLSKEDVAGTISILKKFPLGSTFAFSYMQLDENKRPAFCNQGALTTSWLDRKRERFVWGESTIGIETFVRVLGLHVKDQFSGDDLYTKYLALTTKEKLVTARGENFVSVALRPEN